MKKAKKLGLLFGALAAGAALFAACQGEQSPLSQGAEQAAASDSGALKPVRVYVGAVKASAASGTARSLAPELTELYAEDFEVVFRTKLASTEKLTEDEKLYYRGTGKADDGYITVNVYPNRTYDVLILAGYGQTLLAAAFEKDRKIVSGQANVISLNIEKIPLQWDTAAGNVIKYSTVGSPDETKDPTKTTNDFVFSTDVANNITPPSSTNPNILIKDRNVNIAPFKQTNSSGEVVLITNGGAQNIKTEDSSFNKMTVKFNIAKLRPLIQADVGTEYDTTTTSLISKAALTIKKYYVEINPRYVNNYFPSITFDPDTSGSSVVGPTAVSGYGYKYDTLTIANTTPTNSIISFTSNSKLPNFNAEGLLRFELKYQAFGTEDSGGKDWFIRNGLVRAGADSVKKADAGGSTAGGGSGGKFVIRFGEGIPETIGVPVSTDLDE